jgi:hypothetical protein
VPSFLNTLAAPSTPPLKMEQTGCSETAAHKIQTPGNYPEENIQHSEHGESLKSRKINTFQINALIQLFFVFCLFRTSCVHHQEDYLYMQLFYDIFFVHLCKQYSRWTDMLDTVSSTSVQLLYCLKRCTKNIS